MLCRRDLAAFLARGGFSVEVASATGRKGIASAASGNRSSRSYGSRGQGRRGIASGRVGIVGEKRAGSLGHGRRTFGTSERRAKGVFSVRFLFFYFVVRVAVLHFLRISSSSSYMLASPLFFSVSWSWVFIRITVFHSTSIVSFRSPFMVSLLSFPLGLGLIRRCPCSHPWSYSWFTLVFDIVRVRLTFHAFPVSSCLDKLLFVLSLTLI